MPIPPSSCGYLLRPTCLAIALAVAATGAARHGEADPGRRIGGGNIPVRGDKAKLEALKAIEAGMCRVPVDARAYWDGRAATPEKADAAVLMAHRYGITPMLLFEYYTRWHGELGGYDKWRAIGRAFAERFRPDSGWLKSKGIRGWGVTFYSAINEPMWKSNNPTPIPPAQYARAMEGLADGVHSVGAKLRVSPGGYQEVPLFQRRNPYIQAVAPLYRNGKLHAVDIHRYWDVKYVPMQKGRAHSLQSQFDMVKKWLGLPDSVRFYTTEMNFKKRLVTEEQAAEGLLTALWDALTVVGDDGKVVTEFVLPWNLFNLAAKDTHYGMCTKLDPWTPTARGKVIRMVCRLTGGMEIVSTDPRKTGVTVLAGAGRKLWVWQNRKGWSSLHGKAFHIDGVPDTATQLHVYAWNGLLRTVPLNGRTSLILRDLLPGQTYMFLAKPAAP